MHTIKRSLLAALVSAFAFTGAAMAQTATPSGAQATDPAVSATQPVGTADKKEDAAAKATHQCLSKDGKELQTADKKPVTSKEECDKQGGKLEVKPKGQ